MDKKIKRVPISGKVKPDLKRLLVQQAKKEKRSKSSMLEIFIDEALANRFTNGKL